MQFMLHQNLLSRDKVKMRLLLFKRQTITLYIYLHAASQLLSSLQYHNQIRSFGGSGIAGRKCAYYNELLYVAAGCDVITTCHKFIPGTTTRINNLHIIIQHHIIPYISVCWSLSIHRPEFQMEWKCFVPSPFRFVSYAYVNAVLMEVDFSAFFIRTYLQDSEFSLREKWEFNLISMEWSPSMV